jgi:hypothetical protein
MVQRISIQKMVTSEDGEVLAKQLRKHIAELFSQPADMAFLYFSGDMARRPTLVVIFVPLMQKHIMKVCLCKKSSP